MKAPLLAFALLGVGCSAPAGQVISGRVATDFPNPVTAVRVVHQGAIVTTAPVAADGTFRITLPAQTNLALQLVSSDKTKLVFPRHVGGNQTLFAVRGGGAPFDLGMIHFVGDANTTTIVFHDASETTDCEDGHDASGAVCADDQDTSGGTCDAADNSDDGETADDGADGGADGETADDGADDVNDGLADDGDAVAEHNFPADGCVDDQSDGETND